VDASPVTPDHMDVRIATDEEQSVLFVAGDSMDPGQVQRGEFDRVEIHPVEIELHQPLSLPGRSEDEYVSFGVDDDALR